MITLHCDACGYEQRFQVFGPALPTVCPACGYGHLLSPQQERLRGPCPWQAAAKRLCEGR